MNQGIIFADGTPDEIRKNEKVVDNLIGAAISI